MFPYYQNGTLNQYLIILDGGRFSILFAFFANYFPFRVCTTGLPSDVTVEVGEIYFLLHKVLNYLNLTPTYCIHSFFMSLLVSVMC